MSSLFRSFSEILRHELLIAYRTRRELLAPLVFFCVVATLFPIAISPDPVTLSRLAPGGIWIAALLAVLLSLDKLFFVDYLEGALDHWLLAPQPLSLLVFAKVLAHWLTTGLPLVIMAPVLGFMLQLPTAATLMLGISLLLGTPILSLVGAIGTALTVTLPRGGLLLAVLVLPLYIPVLILGVSAVVATMSGIPAIGQLAWLAALLCLSCALAPLAIAFALRVGVH